MTALKSRATSYREWSLFATAVGFGAIHYLEVLDASFSFDGVIGAFALTTSILLLAIGAALIGYVLVSSVQHNPREARNRPWRQPSGVRLPSGRQSGTTFERRVVPPLE